LPPRTSKPRVSADAAESTFRERLEQAKRISTLQVLFKVARLLDEAALARVAENQAGPRLRRSHMSLLPHIALEGTRSTELADKLGISKQAVSKLVDELVELGVLARLSDPDDARARRVAFTKRGRAGFFEGLAVLQQLEAELLELLGEERLGQLRSALLDIHDQLVPTS
jgi:DNA-binding MarR family transcriptional regulator